MSAEIDPDLIDRIFTATERTDLAKFRVLAKFKDSEAWKQIEAIAIENMVSALQEAMSAAYSGNRSRVIFEAETPCCEL